WTGTAARPAPRTASQSAAVAYATVSPTGSYPAMGLVTDLLPHLVNGVSLGLLFALIALGFMLILGVMEVINLAHGSLFALGACHRGADPRALGYARLRAACAAAGLGRSSH